MQMLTYNKSMKSHEIHNYNANDCSHKSCFGQIPMLLSPRKLSYILSVS